MEKGCFGIAMPAPRLSLSSISIASRKSDTCIAPSDILFMISRMLRITSDRDVIAEKYRTKEAALTFPCTVSAIRKAYAAPSRIRMTRKFTRAVRMLRRAIFFSSASCRSSSCARRS